MFKKTKEEDKLMYLFYDATKVYMILKNSIPKLVPYKIQISI